MPARSIDLERAPHVHQRERIGLAADLDQQAADHRQRERQLQHEAHALPRLVEDPHRAAHALDHLVHGIEPDAAARHVGDLLAHREPRQQQEFQHLGIGQASGRPGIGQALPHDRRAHRRQVGAGPVVGHADQERAGAVARLQRDARLGRLAASHAQLGGLDAVVERVAQQVAERRVEHVEQVAIDLGGFADDRETHPLAQRTRQVAHHARIGAGGVAERPHPALQRLVVELLGDMAAAPLEAVELVDAGRERALQVVHHLPHLVERGLAPGVEIVGQAFVERVERARRVALRAPDAQHRIGEGLEPARFDQRFARQAQQPVQAVGAHAAHLAGVAGAVVAVARGRLDACGRKRLRRGSRRRRARRRPIRRPRHHRPPGAAPRRVRRAAVARPARAARSIRTAWPPRRARAAAARATAPVAAGRRAWRVPRRAAARTIATARPARRARAARPAPTLQRDPPHRPRLPRRHSPARPRRRRSRSVSRKRPCPGRRRAPAGPRRSAVHRYGWRPAPARRAARRRSIPPCAPRSRRPAARRRCARRP